MQITNKVLRTATLFSEALHERDTQELLLHHRQELQLAFRRILRSPTSSDFTAVQPSDQTQNKELKIAIIVCLCLNYVAFIRYLRAQIICSACRLAASPITHRHSLYSNSVTPHMERPAAVLYLALRRILFYLTQVAGLYSLLISESGQ